MARLPRRGSAAALATAVVLAALAARPPVSRAAAAPARARADSAAYALGRRYMRWLLDGRADSLAPRLSPRFAAAVGGEAGLATRLGALVERAGAETAVVSETVYEEPGGTEYYRVSRFAKLPDTTLTTHWAWHADTILGVENTVTPTPAPSAYLDYVTKTPLHLPLASPPGARWFVAWGGRTVQQNYHAVAVDQRFAYDFVLARGDALHDGDGSTNEQYYCFGTPVLAPAAGTVVVALDTVADNSRPGVRNHLVPTGNYVVIDHGDGEYSLLAHFRRGSLRVHPGDRVAAGQQLGECGNSGNATLPHVHYHLQRGADYHDGVGLPVTFLDYESNGRRVARGEPVRGEYLTVAR